LAEHRRDPRCARRGGDVSALRLVVNNDTSRTLKVSNEMFLEAMFEGAPPNTYTIVTSFVVDPNEAKPRHWFGQPWCPGCELPFGFHIGNTYLTVSLFTPDPETGERRRRKTQFHSLRAVMIDDIGTKIDRKRIRLKPSVVIETSPGNEQHFLFIKQDRDSHNRERCEQLIDAMIKGGLTSAGTDPGMRGVTRYGRLPVGINNKSKYVEKLGHAFQVRCLSFEPLRRYTINEIISAWGLDLAQAPTRAQRAQHLTPAQLATVDAKFAALLETLELIGLYKKRCGSGPWHEVSCPWVHEHTDHTDSGAYVAEPSKENGFHGGFKCHHAHGDRLHIEHLRAFICHMLKELSAIAGRKQRIQKARPAVPFYKPPQPISKEELIEL
jgi:hypothetical protein